MRWAIILLAAFWINTAAFAQEPMLNPRYSFQFDTDGFPQSTPKETLASLLKAIELRKVDYLLAHLAEPVFVDSRVAEVHKGSFTDLVQETIDKLRDDPESIALLRRFLQKGKFETQDVDGTATLDGVKDCLYFKRYENRWFFENRKKANP